MKELALRTFNEMDTDKSGKVSFQEYKASMLKKARLQISESALKDLFAHFDENRDGELSLEEIEKLVVENK